jgi:hypothetical protein
MRVSELCKARFCMTDWLLLQQTRTQISLDVHQNTDDTIYSDCLSCVPNYIATLPDTLEGYSCLPKNAHICYRGLKTNQYESYTNTR